MTTHNYLKKSALALAISLSVPTMALAQNQLVLEEVIVTAQKRSQSLQDVPVSVSVMTGETITEVGISGLEEMSAYVPNLVITDGSQTMNITMRGLGSSANQGFEQSVGMFVDGVYAGRHRQFRSPFMDIGNVEVLRGPQGTLFGKNTIAGALNITTAKPTEEFEASLRGSYIAETNEYSMEGVVSGAITDTLNGRLAVKGLESDGYMKNTARNNAEGVGKEEQAVRATLVWTPTNELAVTAKFETGSNDTTGANHRNATVGGWEPVFKSEDSNYNQADFYSRSSDIEDSSSNDSQNAMINVDYALDGYTLTSITGYSEYDFKDVQDVDFSPLNMLEQHLDQKFDQVSQEFRITSEIGETFDFLGGIYYQKSNLENRTHLNANFAGGIGGVPVNGNLLSLVDFSPIALGVPLNANSVADVLDPATFTVHPSDPMNPAYWTPLNLGAALLASDLTGAAGGRVIDFKQDSETTAIYGQGTWHAQDNLHVTVGVRYSEEKKDASRSLYLSEPGSTAPLDLSSPTAPLVTGLFNGIFGTFEHDLQDSRKVSNTSPSIKVQYEINDDIMTYVSASKAFKSGGFSESGTDGSLDDFSFDDEKATAFELGSKMSFMDGRGTLNLALFRTEYKDLQVSAFVVDKYVVGNAASAVSQGLELDGVFRLTQSVDLMASMAYLDAKYDKFDNASCTLQQANDAIAESGPAAGQSCTQDLSGQTLPNAPKYTANVGVNHTADIGTSLQLHSNLMLNYTDSMYLQQNLDSTMFEKAHTIVNARVGLSGSNDRWEVALVGKNLTDEEVRTYGAGIPLLSGATFDMSGMPRTIAVQFVARY